MLLSFDIPFDKKTLYIEPYNQTKLIELKENFNNKLDKYRLSSRRTRKYIPHITLCTNKNIDEQTYKLANEKFRTLVAKVEYIWIYNQNMELIKEYKLQK